MLIIDLFLDLLFYWFCQKYARAYLKKWRLRISWSLKQANTQILIEEKNEPKNRGNALKNVWKAIGSRTLYKYIAGVGCDDPSFVHYCGIIFPHVTLKFNKHEWKRNGEVFQDGKPYALKRAKNTSSFFGINGVPLTNIYKTPVYMTVIPIIVITELINMEPLFLSSQRNIPGDLQLEWYMLYFLCNPTFLAHSD